MLSVPTTIIMVVVIIKGRREVWEVMDMFTALKVRMVLCVYTYPQTHQVVHITYV